MVYQNQLSDLVMAGVGFPYARAINSYVLSYVGPFRVFGPSQRKNVCVLQILAAPVNCVGREFGGRLLIQQ